MNKEQILIDALEKIIDNNAAFDKEAMLVQIISIKVLAQNAIQKYKELSVESGWISVEEEPKKNGTYEIWDNGLEIALFSNGKWKSIGKEENGQLSDFRKTLKPSHYRLPPNPPKQ
jgi:hypothetical protein